MDLDRGVGALDRRLGREQLRDRGLGRVRLAGVLEQAGPEDEQPGRVPLDDHLGDHRLDELEAGDRNAELLPLGRVGHRRVDAPVADADAAGGDGVAAEIEGAHRDLEAVADLAEHRIVGNLDRVEGQRRGVGGAEPELAVDLLGREAVGVGRDEEAGEAAMRLGRVGLGEDQRDVGDVAERDPHLLTADPPAAVDPLGPALHRGGVGAGVGLGQPEASEQIAAAESGQPALLLLLGSPALDRAADERGLDRDHRPRGAVGPADLLDDQGVGDVVEAAPAVLLGDRRPEVAHLAEPAGQVGVEARSAVALADPRDDHLVGEPPGGLRDQPLLVAERQVHGQARAALRSASTAFRQRLRGRARRPAPPTIGSATPSTAEIGWISRLVDARKASRAASRSLRSKAPSATGRLRDHDVAGDRVEDPGS